MKPSVPPVKSLDDIFRRAGEPFADTDPWSPSYDPALDSPPPMPGHSYSFTRVPNVFVQEGTKLGNLVNEKNKAYGDSVGKSADLLNIFYPDGIKPSQYADAAAMIRVLDKLCRISQHSVQGADLGGEDPWKDIAGYGLRQVCMRLEDDRSK